MLPLQPGAADAVQSLKRRDIITLIGGAATSCASWPLEARR
jgi:hypothetical protein